jgi:hypothetical protein
MLHSRFKEFFINKSEKISSMKKVFFLTILNFIVFTSLPVTAQKSDVSYKFYGFLRAEGYYNTRSNVDVCDGTHYLYPKDINKDVNGKDLNAVSDNGFYSYNTRLGVDIKGPDVGKAKISAKIETDFAGANSVLRIRQAYLNLNWEKGSSLLLGQTWHPFWGDVAPQVMDLSGGSPFQFLNRNSMLQYSYTKQNLRLRAAAVFQSMMKSFGPSGSDNVYMRRGGIPEMVLVADYISDNFKAGAAVEFLSLRPRVKSDLGYKVSETVSSFSYEVHAKYAKDLFSIAAKSALASNMSHSITLGGYGIHSIDETTGEQEYTPFKHSASWINIIYGNKYRAGLFGGYIKNLGSDKSILSNKNAYGRGLDMDQLFRGAITGSYNLPHWQFGIEYTLSTAWYGEGDNNVAGATESGGTFTYVTNAIEESSGKFTKTHSVTNHRIAGVVSYFF